MPTRTSRISTAARRVRDARGFSLVEIVVVMVIMGILMAIVVPTFFGARKTAYTKTTIAAASAYATAIESYRLDHGNQVPFDPDHPPSSTRTDDFFGCTVDNPSCWPLNGRRFGPLDLIGRPYLRGGAPEQMSRTATTGGYLYLSDTFTSAPDGGGTHGCPTTGRKKGCIAYQALTATTYTLRVYVWTTKPGPAHWVFKCRFSNGTGGNTC